MTVSRVIFLLILAVFVLFGAADVQAQLKPETSEVPEAPNLLASEQADAFRLALLDLAWQAATAYPLDPDIKNRARAEEQVVMGALRIDQPQLAWGLTNKVVNWRKGLCYAEIAHYLIENGQRQHASYFLYQALLHGRDAKQGWRYARVKSRVAAAQILLGREAAADGLIEKEDVRAFGEQLNARAEISSDEEFMRLLNTLDKMVTSVNYESILAGLNGYVKLYRIHFDNEKRRNMLRQRVSDAPTTLPGLNRFDAIMDLVKAAADHGNTEVTIELLDEAERLFKSFNWPLEMYAPMMAGMARYRAIAGQEDRSRELIKIGLAYSDEKQEEARSFERADMYRPYAEVYSVLGDQKVALEMYRRVVELGAVNPNMRPRVSDITATCVSMALHSVEPDTNLLAAMQAIVDELKTR